MGQLLYDGKDFLIVDFEGEPARSLSMRRIKRSALRDVAGMMRSFDYATFAALFKQVERGNVQADALASFAPWAHYWSHWVSAIFFQAYRQNVRPANLLPASPEELQILLEVNLLAKAVYELGYELNHRPDWLTIPLQGLLRLLSGEAGQ